MTQDHDFKTCAIQQQEPKCISYKIIKCKAICI